MENTIEFRREQAHIKIMRLIEGRYFKQKDLADMMGIKYRTLWNRKKDKNWTGKEIEIIENL